MGNFFVGPYFACGLKNEKATKVVGTREKLVCNNEKCEKFKKTLKGKFCSSCGGKSKKTKVEIIKNMIDIYDIEESLDYELVCKIECGYIFMQYCEQKNIHIWAPDLDYETDSFAFAVDSEKEDDSYCFPVVNAAIIETQKRNLIGKYKKEYLYLMEVYGKDQVKVEWGIFPNC